jgi:hypothetical protein
MVIRKHFCSVKNNTISGYRIIYFILKNTFICLGKEIKKIEDLNHFSKRMKRALETKKREFGREKLSDGKTIGGKNRLSGEFVLDKKS